MTVEECLKRVIRLCADRTPVSNELLLDDLRALLRTGTEHCLAVITTELERAKADGRTIVAGALQDCHEEILRTSPAKGGG